MTPRKNQQKSENILLPVDNEDCIVYLHILEKVFYSYTELVYSMKITTTMTFSILVIVAGLVTVIPSASAETLVSIPSGSSAPGCDETNSCFVPYEVTVDVGEQVTWSNDDTAAHTVTSGSAADGPDGIFDSSLFMAGTTFSNTFDQEGVFNYFCMVHPWMQGIVTVGTASAETSSTEITATESAMDAEITLDYDITGGKVTGISPDIEANSIFIKLDATDQGSIAVTLPRDVIDATINGEDDDFFVIIDGEEVDFDETKTSTDRTLTIAFPAGAEEIEIIGTFVVPEFGTITAMILAIAIISIIAVSAKSRLGIMPRL